MEKHFDIIRECPLFSGIEEEELRSLLGCIGAENRRYKKGSFIFTAGGSVTSIGIILSGSVHVLQEDFWGTRTILAMIGPGGLFGESFASAGMENLPVSVLAVEPCDILFIDFRRVATPCSFVCGFHVRLIKNMMRILAEKNILLTQKIEFLTRRTTREKLLAYLSAQARATGSGSFKIPFNRQELAEYLSVDRSAMSSELSKMHGEGILSFNRSHFELYSDWNQ